MHSVSHRYLYHAQTAARSKTIPYKGKKAANKQSTVDP